MARRYDPVAEPYYTHASPTLLSQTEADPKPTRLAAKESREWETLYQHLEQRRAALYTWRLPWWTTWCQIARYELPRRFYWYISENTNNQGLRQDFNIIDRTATLCGGKCAAGLMAGLTDPDRVWANFGPGIPGYELDQQGQSWYEDVGERYRYILDHSNFYDSQAQHYEDVVFFGTSPVIDYADERQIIRCRVPSAGEFMLANGYDNEDDTLYEELRLTVSQIIEMFGPENCPEDVLDMWRQKGGAIEYQNVIGHAIEPNFPVGPYGSEAGIGVVPGGYPWREVYWIRGKKNARPLAMAGFHEQPFGVSRWNTQGSEPYGRGVGEDMLGDAIQLQLETRQKAQSIEKVNNPPMGADVSLMNQPASQAPGKITYMNTGSGGEKKFWSLYEIKPDIPALSADIKLIQDRLARTAFNDVFQPMEDLRQETKAQITATEIDAIKEERLLPLGPVFGRIYGTLRLRVRRHLVIMGRRGLIPPKPASLRGVPTKIEFVSMLTAAQKATRTAAIARSTQYIGSISGAFPAARFLLNAEKAGREFNDGVGAPSDILNPPNKVKQLMEQFQQQSQAAAALSQTQVGAESAKTLSQAKLAPGSALSALVGGQGV